jgi:hypothetical protein
MLGTSLVVPDCDWLCVGDLHSASESHLVIANVLRFDSDFVTTIASGYLRSR